MEATSFADMNREESEEPQPEEEEEEFAVPKLVKPLPNRASPVASPTADMQEQEENNDEEEEEEDAEVSVLW